MPVTPLFPLRGSGAGTSSVAGILRQAGMDEEEDSIPVLMSALRWLSRPGWAVRSLISGDFEGAGLNLAQMALDFPGGIYSRKLSAARFLDDDGDLTTRKQRPEFSEVWERWGGDAPKHGTWGRFGLDMAGGMVFDPLTWASGVGGVGRSLAKGALTGAADDVAKRVLVAGLRESSKGRALLGGAKGATATGIADDLFWKTAVGSGKVRIPQALGFSQDLAQGDLLDSVVKQLAKDRMIIPEGVGFGVPFMRPRGVISTEGWSGLKRAAATPLLGPAAWGPGGLKAAGKHGVAPALAGGLLGDAGGAALGVGAAAAARHFAPDLMKGLDQQVAKSMNLLGRKLYDKTIGPILYDQQGKLRSIPQGVQRFVQKLDQERLGFLYQTKRGIAQAFEGIDEKTAEGMTDVLEEFHLVQQQAKAVGGTPPSFTQLKPAIVQELEKRLGVPAKQGGEIVDLYHGSMDKIRQEMVAFGTAAKKSGEIYVPRQAGRWILDALDDADPNNEAFKRGLREVFAKERRYGTVEEFEDRIIDMVQEAGLEEQVFKTNLGSLPKLPKTPTPAQVAGLQLAKQQRRQAILASKPVQEAGGIRESHLAQILMDRAESHGHAHYNRQLVKTAQEKWGLKAGHPFQRVLQRYVAEVYSGPSGQASGALRGAVGGKVGHVGIRGRGPAGRTITAINRYYKPALTHLAPSFHFRNAVSTLFQTLLDPSLDAKDAFRLGWWYFRDLVTASKLRLDGDRMGILLDAINKPTDAAALARARSISAGLKKDMGLDADEVLDWAGKGVVDSQHFSEAELVEQLAAKGRRVMAQNGWKKNPAAGAWQWANNLGRSVSRFVENRARLNSFMSLVQKGADPRDAITRTQRAFVKYDFQSSTDKALRSALPFVRFTTGTAPIAAAEMVRRPVLGLPFARARGNLEGDPNRPLASLPERARAGFQVPVGGGDLLSPLGLPPEVLGDVAEMLPGTGKGIGGAARGILLQAHPLLKYALEAGTGRKIYSGRRFGSYGAAPKWAEGLPGVSTRRLKGGKVSHEIGGNAYELLQAGPWSRASSTASKFLDEKHGGILDRLAKLFTGISVDTPDQRREALLVVRRIMEEKMLSGDVGALERFYARGEAPPELIQALRALGALEKRPEIK